MKLISLNFVEILNKLICKHKFFNSKTINNKYIYKKKTLEKLASDETRKFIRHTTR